MKGVIIAAGYGTRFLPATKSIPKEMFPLIDTPAIDIIVEEFIQAGIKDILIVTSRRKKSLEDYFDREIELETLFNKENAQSKLKKIQLKDVNIFFRRQEKMLGTGHAILICKEFIGNEPFIIAYPDDLVFAKTSLSQQLITIHQKTQACVLAVQEIEGDVDRYGVVDYSTDDNLLKVRSLVEKPAKGTEPSHMISVGRYLFTSDLFPLLEANYQQHQQGEFYHIDSINQLASSGKVYACPFQGERIDVGDRIGYLEGVIKYALSRDDLKDEAKKIIKTIASQI